jgi:hypothetical protein
MWEAGKAALQMLGDWANSQEYSGSSQTYAGYFDTSYPCG